MKKLFAILLVTMMVLSLVACGEKKETTETPKTDEAVTEDTEKATDETEEKAEEAADTAADEATDEAADDADEAIDPPETLPLLIINNEPYMVSCEDGFDNAGFTGFKTGETAKLSFTSSTKDVTWTVYVLDQEFTDSARYIPQAETPALEGDGTIEIEAEKCVYVECSVNGFTADEPADATLSVDYAE